MKRSTALFLILISTLANAQLPGITSIRNLFWAAPSLNVKFTDHWMLVSDALYRMEVSDGDIFQIGIRAGARYITTKQWLITAGPAFFLHYPNPNGNTARPELRAWQEIAKRFEIGSHAIVTPRIRLEQRFFREYNGTELADAYSFHSVRLRLRGEFFYRFGGSENTSWSLVTGDEIMFHYRGSGFSAFDQNRAWIGPQYKYGELIMIQLAYLNIVQQRSSSGADLFHILRLTVQFSLDLTAKNDQAGAIKNESQRTFAAVKN